MSVYTNRLAVAILSKSERSVAAGLQHSRVGTKRFKQRLARCRPLQSASLEQEPMAGIKHPRSELLKLDGFDQKQVLKHPKDPKSFSRSWYLVRAGLQLPTLHNWCMMRMIHGSLPSLNSTGHKSVMKMSEVEPVSAETMGHQAAPLQRREASLHRQVSYLEQNLSSQEPAEAWAIGSQPHKRSYWNITCIILQWYELDTQQMSGCHWNEDQSHGSHGAISMHHLPSQSQANATILRAPWCRGMRW